LSALNSNSGLDLLFSSGDGSTASLPMIRSRALVPGLESDRDARPLPFPSARARLQRKPKVKQRKQPQNRGIELAVNIIETSSSKPSAWEVDEAQIANVPDEYRRLNTNRRN